MSTRLILRKRNVKVLRKRKRSTWRKHKGGKKGREGSPIIRRLPSSRENLSRTPEKASVDYARVAQRAIFRDREGRKRLHVRPQENGRANRKSVKLTRAQEEARGVQQRLRSSGRERLRTWLRGGERKRRGGFRRATSVMGGKY